MTPQERLRKHQRALEKTQRELDRERVKLENQEKKLVQDIKKSAKVILVTPEKRGNRGLMLGAEWTDGSVQDTSKGLSPD